MYTANNIVESTNIVSFCVKHDKLLGQCCVVYVWYTQNYTTTHNSCNDLLSAVQRSITEMNEFSMPSRSSATFVWIVNHGTGTALKSCE